MLIKMICGTYGAQEDGVVVAKTIRSAPFEVEEKKGRELITLGYAQEVKSINTDVKSADAFKTEGEQDNNGRNLTDYSLQDLRKLAKKKGLDTTGSKQQIIERIQSCEINSEEESRKDEAAPVQSGEEPPVLMPAEPEA